MIRLFSKYFSGNTELDNLITLKIFNDKIKSKSTNSINLNVEKILKMKDLRKRISEIFEKNEDEIVLMIDGKFWDDERKIEDVVKEIRSVDGVIEVRAVIVTLEEQETIDYDVELFLREKYAAVDIPEVVDIYKSEGVILEEVQEAISVICGLCLSAKSQDRVLSMDYCGHVFCKICLSDLILKNLGKVVKCPYNECKRNLDEHEFQKILGSEDYMKWENTVYKIFKENNNFIIPKVGWICQSCTFLNKPLLKFCDVCTGERPDEYRIPVFYEPSNEEKLNIAKLEQELQEQEIEKLKRLEELRNLSKESVTFTSETTECPVCLLDYEAKEAIVLHSCLHTICKGCLHSYLVNIEDAQVKCPTENCIGLLEDREIREILTEAEYGKYQDLNLRMAEAKEQFSFHCKAVNCQGWIVHDGFLTSFACPRCKIENCIKCQAIHEGTSCQEYQLKMLSAEPDSNQTKNEMYIQSMIKAGNAMKCPGCKMIVEKNRGCDGVLCRGCGMMICWATKGPRWGPKGKGDRSGGCGCRFFWGQRCHPSCHYCH